VPVNYSGAEAGRRSGRVRYPHAERL